MKSLYCDVCERHFNAKVSTPDDVAFLKHGNKSKYHVDYKKKLADDVSILSSESEDFGLTNESSFIGLEERRLNVSVASEYLNQFSSSNNDAISESSSLVGVSNFSSSSSNNMYWNAMVSPEKTGLIEFYDSLKTYVGETESEEDVFEDDLSTSFGSERSNGLCSQSEKSYMDSESSVYLSNDDVSITSATERRSSLNSENRSYLGSDGDFDEHGNNRCRYDNLKNHMNHSCDRAKQNVQVEHMYLP